MQNQDTILKNAAKAKSLCFATFFFLGNYFAMYGLFLADKAVRELAFDRRKEANELVLSARKWGIWGLVPSTILNIALIYFCFLAVWELGLKDIYAAISKLH